MEVAPGAGEEQLPPGKVTRTPMLDMAASVAPDDGSGPPQGFANSDQALQRRFQVNA